MSIISLIIKREFVAKVRNKSFIVMTFLSPLLFVGIAAFVGYLSTMKADTKKIALHDESGLFFNEFKTNSKADSEYVYQDLSSVELQPDSIRLKVSSRRLKLDVFLNIMNLHLFIGDQMENTKNH